MYYGEKETTGNYKGSIDFFNGDFYVGNFEDEQFKGYGMFIT